MRKLLLISFYIILSFLLSCSKKVDYDDTAKQVILTVTPSQKQTINPTTLNDVTDSQTTNSNSTHNIFKGDWNRTNVTTGCAAEIKIESQTTKSFDFTFVGTYGGNGGSIDGTAIILNNNKAIFEYRSEDDNEVYAKVEFQIENDVLIVKLIDGFNYALGFGNKVFIDGKYTKSIPRYTNENIINEILKTKEIKKSMRNLLGGEAYKEVLDVIQDGERYDDNVLDYSGFLDGCGQGVDLVIKGNKIYCLGYFIGAEGYVLYTNDENYKDSLPSFFHIDRTDYKLSFVCKP